MTTTRARAAVTDGLRSRPGYRPDVEGLRAVAVLLVIAFHAGVPFVGGGYVGVDVFFVISGFLITGLLLREAEQTGWVDLPRFWARRIRRLLPAASLALLGVIGLTVAFLPVTRWSAVAGDVLASAFYLVNWRLADRSVDYLAADDAASPVQHFWSLAIEEQFYILWPLLIVAALWLWGRRRSRRSRHGAAVGRVTARRAVLACLLLVAVPSLVWSVQLTGVDPGQAYFVSTTRLWELALGGVVAVLAPALGAVPSVVARALGWVGLAAIVWAGWQYSASTPFPGLAALVPTLGAAGVLVAGLQRPDAGVGRVLAVGGMERIGTLSYSLYLWHWPPLVVATYLWADSDGVLALPVAISVAAASAVPAWLAFRLLERPVHRSQTLAAHPARAFGVALLCAVLVAGAALAVMRAVQQQADAAPAAAVPQVPVPQSTPQPQPTKTEEEDAGGSTEETDEGTEAEDFGEIVFAESVTPDPVEAAEDNPELHDDGCYQNQPSTDVVSCVYGDPDAARTVALVGDSHAAHWQPALTVAAQSQGWRLETYIKSACFFGESSVWLRRIDQEYTACSEWNQNVLAELAADPPDLVVIGTSGEYDAVEEGRKVEAGPEADGILAGALADRWGTLIDDGSALVVLSDTPWYDTDVPECVGENRPQVGECNVDRDWGLERSGAAIQRPALESEQRAGFVDLTDALCTPEVCPAVRDGVLTMRDTHHLTATYSRSLGGVLEARLLETLDGLGVLEDLGGGSAESG